MRRALMLKAAKEVFAEKGYGKSTLDEIAQRAEFGKGTLYNYFPEGKEGLLFAIFDELFDELENLIQESFGGDRLSQGTFRATMEAFIHGYVGFFEERENLFFILLKEAHRMCFGENMEHFPYFRKQRIRMLNALKVPIQQAIAAGWLRDVNPIMAAHMVLHNMEGLQVHMLMERYAGGDAAEASMDMADASSFLTNMLLDGFALPAASDTSD